MNDYIGAGLDKEVVDPDDCANVEKKRQKLEEEDSSTVNLNKSLTFPDLGWQSSLKSLPPVSFASIYHHFMERSVLVAARKHLSLSKADESGPDGMSSFKRLTKGLNLFGWSYIHSYT